MNNLGSPDIALSNTLEHVMDLGSFLSGINELNPFMVNYNVWGPIRSHVLHESTKLRGAW